MLRIIAWVLAILLCDALLFVLGIMGLASAWTLPNHAAATAALVTWDVMLMWVIALAWAWLWHEPGKDWENG